MKWWWSFHTHTRIYYYLFFRPMAIDKWTGEWKNCFFLVKQAKAPTHQRLNNKKEIACAKVYEKNLSKLSNISTLLVSV